MIPTGEDRAVSVGIASFFGSLAAGAIVYYILVVEFGSELYAMYLADAQGSVSNNAVAWLWTAGEVLLIFVFLAVAAFGLLVYAVYLRAVTG